MKYYDDDVDEDDFYLEDIEIETLDEKIQKFLSNETEPILDVCDLLNDIFPYMFNYKTNPKIISFLIDLKFNNLNLFLKTDKVDFYKEYKEEVDTSYYLFDKYSKNAKVPFNKETWIEFCYNELHFTF